MRFSAVSTRTGKTTPSIYLHKLLDVTVRASQTFAYLRYGRIGMKVAPLKGFPTIEDVERADKEQLARWYRFLPSGETAADQKIMKRIAKRFEKLGGMTAELSKKIGI